MVIDGVGTRPTGLAADQVGLAVTVDVEQGGYGRVGKITEVGNPVLRSSREINEIALQGPGIDLRADRFHKSFFEVLIMGREPSINPKIHLPGRHRVVELLVLHGDRTFHKVPQTLEEDPIDLRLEPSRVPRRPRHANPSFVGIRIIGLTDRRSTHSQKGCCGYEQTKDSTAH